MFKCITGFFIFGILFSVAASADAVDDAYAKRAQAAGDYYDALKKNPSMGKAERQQLYDKTLEPAQTDLDRARTAEIQSALPHGHQPVKPMHLIDKAAKSKSRSKAPRTATAAKSGSGVSRHVEAEPDIQRESVTVDGNGVPTELDFGNAAKSKPKPSPSENIVEPGIRGR